MSQNKLPNKDDGVRQRFAVGISIDDRREGVMRLILDDLVRKEETPSEWRRWAFFTFIDVSQEKAAEHQLTEKEYAAIGEMVLARLLALRSL
jgi:hypothetical protein